MYLYIKNTDRKTSAHMCMHRSGPLTLRAQGKGGVSTAGIGTISASRRPERASLTARTPQFTDFTFYCTNAGTALVADPCCTAAARQLLVWTVWNRRAGAGRRPLIGPPSLTSRAQLTMCMLTSWPVQVRRRLNNHAATSFQNWLRNKRWNKCRVGLDTEKLVCIVTIDS